MIAAFHQLPQSESLVTHPQQNTVGRFGLRRTIVLTGLMGAGKTSVGRRLARELRVSFSDSDQEIEAAANLKIPEIFENFGEDYFRAGEERVILRLLRRKPGVLATGGGAFLSPVVREGIAGCALSVWLRADPATLFERIKHKTGRPLLQNADPKAVLEQLHVKREPIYASADVVVESPAGISQNDMAQRIISAIRNHDAARSTSDRTLRELAT